MEYAKLIWDKNTPKSEVFDDFYFSSRSGIDESKYNFLEHNFLEKRFRSLEENQSFYICETGFGSGLNFILTMKLWQKSASENNKLEFISFEKYPLKLIDLKKVLTNFDGLTDFYDSLLDQYSPTKGLNTYEFDNVKLNLIIDDVNNIGQYKHPKINAWFLDGFAPRKNSSMWGDNLFKNMSILATKDTSFATFTASSMVRKSLQNEGFHVLKDKGFGRKREMMYGYFKW